MNWLWDDEESAERSDSDIRTELWLRGVDVSGDEFWADGEAIDDDLDEDDDEEAAA